MPLFLRTVLFLSFTFAGLLAAAATSASAQQVPVTFSVNMNHQVSLGNFNPDTNFVDVAGTFNSWGATPRVLADPEGDGIYHITLQNFTPGQTIQFKFRIDGAWDGREEFPGGGPNRSYTVTAGPNEISVWYNDELPPDGPPVAGFSPQSVTVFENGVVSFSDLSGGEVTEWEWHFEGGVPATSQQRNPVVSYPNTGSFGVTLIARHENLADTLSLSDVVQVQLRESTETHWWNHTVFYEMFARSFFDTTGDGTGDFQGMIEKLDYLNDGDPDSGESLGITGIWLMPIHPSPSYHGYDVTDYLGVNSDFGTLETFRTFVEEAQSRGIRVIIDFVLNHTSSQHPWFINSRNNVPGYRDYFRWSATHPGYNGPWGQPVWHSWGGWYYYGLFWGGMPDVNFHNEEVKEKLFQAADFWLSDVGVDGFRLDAVTYIFEDGTQLEHTEETFAFWAEFNERVKSNNPDAVTIGEAWTSTENIIPYVTNDRLDLAFEFDLASAILSAARNGDARGLRTQMQKVHNSYNYLQYATFLTNHDQNRVMNELGDDWNKARTAAAIYLTLPGVPFLYYGEEIGMRGAKPDPQIRTPMQWTDGPNAGFTTGTPWINLNPDFQIRNVAVQQQDPNSLLNWYRRLIQVRNQEIALRIGDYIPVEASRNSLFGFLRSYGQEQLLVAINTGTGAVSDAAFTLAGAALQPGTYTLDELLSGESITLSVQAGNRIVVPALPAHGALILRLGDAIPVSAEPEAELPARMQLHQNYPNPFNPVTQIRFELAQPAEVRLSVYNLQGQRVATLADGWHTSGSHQLAFNGSALASGLYLYRLTAAGQQLTRKMMLVK